ncbi:MAG: DNA polymerase III subunit gamma/tau [Lachnospiraceae bacterium]|nr:DNA polymerase III subunit gamma/tau [Lachnospiraceae bacterium]
MAYTALYRKWRPTKLEDVRGQEHIVRTLENQIQSGRIGHAYLFCGTRGTGKTTVAKILARAVNCEHPVNGSPCNECAVCKSILAGTSVNVAEIDAASNNGVDNIREIREQVQYSPTEGKYRVYIIDEVHMLSQGAFNALLKTLEEPPSYVIFILATTEANKIPITVLSRCQRYDFRRIGNDVIAGQIANLLREEDVAAEDAAIRYVAKAADGSMRDALSLLEQCISFYYGQTLTYERVLDVLGAVDTEVFSRLIRLLMKKDVPGCIALIDEITSQGRELGQFVLDFTWYQRNLMLVQTAAQGADALDMSMDNYQALREEAQMIDLDTLMRNIRICSELSNRIRYATSKRVLLEMSLIKMMQPAMEDDTESLKIRLGELEEKVASGVVVSAQGAAMAGASGGGSGAGAAGYSGASGMAAGAAGIPGGQEAGPVVELSPAEFEDYDTLRSDWLKICSMQSPFIYSLLKGSRLGYDKDRGLCVLFEDGFKYATMMRDDRLENLRQFINQQYGKNFRMFARALSAGEAAPKVVRGRNIPGIEMEIEDS